MCRDVSWVVQLVSGLSWRGRVQGLAVLRDLLHLLPGDLLAPNLCSVLLAMLRLLPGKISYLLLLLLLLLLLTAANCCYCS